MSRTLAVCADDFGLDRAISETIAALAAAGRLQAVSCLCNLAAWPACAQLLRALPDTVACGLHFNLTEGEPLSPALGRRWPRPPGLSRLLLESALGRLPSEAIADELQAQWQAFAAATGRAPDFIDGHQHVHALRGVRENVLELARARGVAVRSTGRVRGPGFVFKRRVIEVCGGRALARALSINGLAHNARLVGVYDFVESDYRGLLRRWLAALPNDDGESTLLFCHPGAAGDALPRDPIAAAREREAAYFGSAEFTGDLAEFGVTLTPPWPRKA